MKIEKNKIQEFFKKISKGKILIAPKLLPDGDLIYSYIDNCEEISLNVNIIPVLSAKEFFFKDEEELFEFEYTPDQNLEFVPIEEPPEQIFVGIRSCDMKGVRFLDKFYRESFGDETVTKKIERTTFISLGCNQPCESCFCVCCDGGPFLTEGTDIQLIDLGDSFLLEIFSQKVNELLSPYDELFKPADEEDMKRKIAIMEEVDSKFNQRSYMSMGIKDMSLDKVPDEVWELLNNRCISCGSCTYVCPTCSCFNVYDRKTAKGGSRIRTWDSCNYAGFTREVSGHNPRPEARDRLKRRFFHKLSYQCLHNNGRIGCVGCGRCIVSCPSLLDMSTFVTTLRETKTGNKDE